MGRGFMERPINNKCSNVEEHIYEALRDWG